MKIFAVLLLALATTAAAHAGTTGIVHGIVTDQRGLPIAGVHVIAEAPSGRVDTHTDAQGFYAFISLNPDRYTFSFEKPAMSAASFAGIDVAPDRVIALTPILLHMISLCHDVVWRTPAGVMRPGVVGDVYIVLGKTYSAWPNPLAMELQTVPGVALNAGPPMLR